MDYQNCQIFTPQWAVELMLDEVGYRDNNIYGKKIIDNSCGDGSFLKEIVRRLVLTCERKGYSKKQTKKSLESCVFGFEIDEQAYKNCINNLDDIASSFNLKEVKWNIYHGDGLSCQLNGQFDFVVGNPPYITYKNLTQEQRDNTKENFKSCSIGKFDYSYAFIEKGLHLLKSDGKMVMITPSNMFKTVFGGVLREIIKPDLTMVIDCAKKKIFDKMISPAITLYHKNNKSSVIIYKEYSSEDLSFEKLINKAQLIDKWNFTEYNNEGNNRFGDNFKVSNCIATLANKVFVHNINESGSLDISVEDDVLKATKSPRSEQFGIDQKIIFPYYYDVDGFKKYSEQEMYSLFPRAMKYLETQREILDARDSDSSAEWFQYGRSQALAHLNCDKILISSIVTKEIIPYKLDCSIIPYSGLYIKQIGKESLDTAMLIIKTKRFYNYLLSKGIKVHGESIRISSKDIEDYRY